MTDEDKAKWIFDNLLEDNQAAAIILNGKSAMAIRRRIDHSDYWYNLCLSHVKGEPIKVNTVSTKTKQEREKTGIALGIYFGGRACKGLCRSVAIDCDKNNATDLLKPAMEAFPELAFFQRNDNSGRWHAHGRISEPVDDYSLKIYMQSRLPDALKGTEVFPKTSRARQAIVGNQIRLPMSPHVPYYPVRLSMTTIPASSISVVDLGDHILHDAVGTHDVSNSVSNPVIDAFDSNPVIDASALKSKLLKIISANGLYPYVKGFVISSLRNSQSEFDWRFCDELKRLGYTDPALLRTAILYRNPTIDPKELTVTINNVVASPIRSFKPYKQLVHDKELSPVGFEGSWFHVSDLWRYKNGMQSARNIYLAHIITARDFAGFKGDGWSEPYCLSVRSINTLGYGCGKTVLKNNLKLRAIGLLELIESGKGHKGSQFRIRLAKREEERVLIQKARWIKEFDSEVKDFAGLMNEITTRWEDISVVDPAHTAL